MKKFPKYVLQEWMMDFGGGGSSLSPKDKLIQDINKETILTQKIIMNELLKKFYNIECKDLEIILEKHHPELLI